MKATNIAFTGIPVTDMKRARSFYEGVLGLELSEEMGGGVWVEYALGNDTLAIANVGEQWLPSGQGTAVAIEVDDFEAAISDLKAAKVELAAEPMDTPCCRMAVVHDPDGNKLIVHKLKPENERTDCK